MAAFGPQRTWIGATSYPDISSVRARPPCLDRIFKVHKSSRHEGDGETQKRNKTKKQQNTNKNPVQTRIVSTCEVKNATGALCDQYKDKCYEVNTRQSIVRVIV